jgi:hypothetical protein
MDGWGVYPGNIPIPPQNGTVVSPFYSPGVLDVRWDNPAILARNANFKIVGVNVYRSDETDRGPYFRINDIPIGGTFYRDQIINAQVRETVYWDTSWIDRGDASNNRKWILRTQHPIHKRYSQAPYQEPTYANTPTDVVLYIDGVEVPVDDVFGRSHEVTLINLPNYNQATEKMIPVILPKPESVVEIIYYTNKNFVLSGSLDVSTFYRLTTVALDPVNAGQYLETELSWCQPLNSSSVENLDYIWKEAIRRNAWILQQGGERVNIFIRKQNGIPCDCNIDPRTLEYSMQPSNRCRSCYGTGYIGGFEGPYSEIISPIDADRRISQTLTGRRQETVYEVFMGPSPNVTQRDFIVKQTNERFSIGPVRRPSNRGNVLQQHFSINSMDEADIRYKVPIDGTSQYPWPQTRFGYRQVVSMPIDGELTQAPSTMPDKPPYPVGKSTQLPMETDNPAWPEEKQPRGRTPVWGNISSGGKG